MGHIVSQVPPDQICIVLALDPNMKLGVSELVGFSYLLDQSHRPIDQEESIVILCPIPLTAVIVRHYPPACHAKFDAEI